MTAVMLRRMDPTRHMARFYSLAVQQDLFGVWVVDVMEELFRFTLLTREWADLLVDRYSERKEQDAKHRAAVAASLTDAARVRCCCFRKSRHSHELSGLTGSMA